MTRAFRVSRVAAHLLAPCLVALLGACGGTSSPPNILLIVADDMGYADLGVMGNSEWSTPHLDTFFEENTSFLRHYTDATCQPTRAGLITGVHPSALGFSAVGYALPDGVPTVAERLRDIGYHTTHIGKWHLGWAIPEATPTAKGFDEYFGFLDQGFLAGPDADGQWRHRRPTHRDPWLGRNDEEPRQHEGHLTDLLTEEAVERIEGLAGSDSAWFVNLWYYAPHDPLEPAERYVREDTPEGRYRALVEHLDDAVGTVLAALEASGAADNTVVVFLSDNGGTNRYLDNNHPLPGGKVGYFEGGIRTPMAIRIPGRDESREIDHPVSYLDIVPTILDLVGAEGDDGLSGFSLLPLLEGDELPPRPMFWEVHSDVLGYAFGVTSEDGRWHYGEDLFADDAILNDLETDVTGRTDLLDSPDHADVLRDLWSEYRDWHDRTRLLYAGRPAGDVVRHDARDVQRTPGYNSVTWSFAVDPSAAAEGPVTVADQNGVASVVVEADRAEVRLFGEVLEGRFAGAAEGDTSDACRTITLSTYADHPNILSNDHVFRATLYLDGAAVAEIERSEAMVRGHEHREPLDVYPAGGAVLGYRVWTEYLREEDSLRQPGVQRVISGLCPTGA